MEVNIVDNLQSTDLLLQEISGEKAMWSLSTAKPGNGIEQIRDENLETYWQSDGGQPHYVNIQFLKKTSVSLICFYIDYNLDESYTPKKINIRSGYSLHDLVDITVIELTEPIGWVTISLTTPNDNQVNEALRTHFLQV